MLPELKSVKSGKNFQLFLKYDNGENRVFDVRPFLKGDEFHQLKSKSFFHSVKLQNGFVYWSKDVGFTAEMLYFRSREYTQQFIMSETMVV